MERQRVRVPDTEHGAPAEPAAASAPSPIHNQHVSSDPPQPPAQVRGVARAAAAAAEEGTAAAAAAIAQATSAAATTRAVARPAKASFWPGLPDSLLSALGELGIHKPTDIQEAALPVILAGQSVTLSAATGTGKTLAYMLPVVACIKRDEDVASIATRPARPRALILAPTRELAAQILGIAKALCHHAKFRVVGILGGRKQSLARKALEGNVDVVVAAPGRLQLALQNEWLRLTDVRYVVIDEADTLIDSDNGFGEDLEAVLAPLLQRHQRSTSKAGSAAAATTDAPLVQYVLAGATIPAAAQHRIRQLFPGAKPLSARSLHRLPPSLRQEFVRVGGEPDAKHDALLRILRDLGHGAEGASHASALQPPSEPITANTTMRRATEHLQQPARKVIVFCNTVPSARSTAHFLADNGISTASLHGGIPPALREEEFAAFTGGVANILVCTDAAARGLDIAALSAVVMFDFPLNAIDYVHRAGRVARAGRPGVAVSIVAKRDQVLATAIERAAETGRDLTTLSSDKVAYLAPADRRSYLAARAARSAAAGETQPGGLHSRRQGERAGRQGFKHKPRKMKNGA